MINFQWDAIENFHSIIEFDQFLVWMTEQLTVGEVSLVDVSSPYLGDLGGFNEKWFRQNSTGQVWRLVWPDAPFEGLFERVN